MFVSSACVTCCFACLAALYNSLLLPGYYTHAPREQNTKQNHRLVDSEDPGDIPGVSWSRSQLTSVSEYSLCFETGKIASCLRGSPASPAHGNLPSANFENSPSANFAKPIAKRSVLVLQGGKEGGKEGEGGKQGAQYLCFLSLSRAWQLTWTSRNTSKRWM